MKTLLLILLMLTGTAASELQATESGGISDHTTGEVGSDLNKFMQISDCTGNFNCYETSDSEINNIIARSFYPANSLNVLKKAYYAFEVCPSDIIHITVAG